MDLRLKRPKSFHEAGDSINGSSQLLLSISKKKDFANSAMQSLNDFRESGVLCDVKLVADSAVSLDTEENTCNKGLQAHRCILAARSDYFKAMFTIGMSESNQQTIKIHDVSHNILKKVIDFLYKGSCKITKGEVHDITAAAAMMQIPSLFDVCREFLTEHLDVYNVFHVWSLADSHQVIDLLRCCAEFIPNHLGVLLEQEEFFCLPASMVHAILKFPKVNLGPQYNLHILRDALRKWMVVNEDKVDQKQKLESHVDCEKLDISFHTDSEESPSHTRRLEATSRITEFPACFSLIAVMGGFLQSRTGGQCPTANTVEILDTSSLTWVNSCIIRTDDRPILFRTVFPVDGMFFFLSESSLRFQSFLGVNLYRFEPVLSRWIEVRRVQEGEALARLAKSTSHVRAMAEGGEEIFFCGSVTVKSADSGKVAFKINVKKNTVNELPDLPSPRYHHGAVVVDGDLFVIGGSTITGEPLASVLILRKGQNEWGEGFPMSSARAGPGVAVLGDYIYAVGGTSVAKRLKTVERYHIKSNRWEPVPAMSCPRAFPGVIAAGDGLFVFGGKSYAGTSEDSGARNVLRSCEKYNPGTKCWMQLPDMEKCRCEMITLTV